MILIFIVPSTVFLNDLNKLQEYIKTHTFQEFYEEYLEKYEDKLKKYKTKTEEIRKKIASLLKKIYNCKINKFIDTISKLSVITGIWYKAFFEEDFYSRRMVFIIFIIMLFYVTINCIIDAIYSRKRSNFILAVVYVAVIFVEICHAVVIYVL